MVEQHTFMAPAILKLYGFCGGTHGAFITIKRILRIGGD